MVVFLPFLCLESERGVGGYIISFSPETIRVVIIFLLTIFSCYTDEVSQFSSWRYTHSVPVMTATLSKLLKSQLTYPLTGQCLFVLLTGDSGAGRTLMAETCKFQDNRLSDRSWIPVVADHLKQPLVYVNCVADDSIVLASNDGDHWGPRTPSPQSRYSRLEGWCTVRWTAASSQCLRYHLGSISSRGRFWKPILHGK